MPGRDSSNFRQIKTQVESVSMENYVSVIETALKNVTVVNFCSTFLEAVHLLTSASLRFFFKY